MDEFSTHASFSAPEGEFTGTVDFSCGTRDHAIADRAFEETNQQTTDVRVARDIPIDEFERLRRVDEKAGRAKIAKAFVTSKVRLRVEFRASRPGGTKRRSS
jgi:hypothetical protein